MERFPNQRVVNTVKQNYTESKVIFYMGCLDNMCEAMAALSGNGFKLYMYFAKNANGYMETISPSHIAKITGLTRPTYYRAFDELVEHHYLCLHKDKSATYSFYEKPHFKEGAKEDEPVPKTTITFQEEPQPETSKKAKPFLYDF